jgi:hypothetical protein
MDLVHNAVHRRRTWVHDGPRAARTLNGVAPHQCAAHKCEGSPEHTGGGRGGRGGAVGGISRYRAGQWGWPGAMNGGGDAAGLEQHLGRRKG